MNSSSSGSGYLAAREPMAGFAVFGLEEAAAKEFVWAAFFSSISLTTEAFKVGPAGCSFLAAADFKPGFEVAGLFVAVLEAAATGASSSSSA